MNKAITTIIILAVLVVGGLLLFADGNNQASDTPQATTSQATTTDQTAEDGTTGEAGEDRGTSANQDDDESNADTPNSAQTDTSADVTITYTDDGFTPSQTTVKQGQTVRFVNESSGQMWVASDQHPTHTEYAGTNLRQHCSNNSNSAFDQCESSDSFSFTFEKAGDWQYHNHVNASAGGTITVQ
jgi:plastocyanin